MLGGLSSRAQDNVIGAAFERLVKDFVGEQSCDQVGFDLDSAILSGSARALDAARALPGFSVCAEARLLPSGRGLLSDRKIGSRRLRHVQKDDFGGE